jgi:hypothetical protein
VSAEMIIAVGAGPDGRPSGAPGEARLAMAGRAAGGRGRRVRPVVGVLADGTAFYAPIGEVVADDSLVICHLCGRGLRSVTAHLRVHGWTKEEYCAAFGLERGQSLEGPATRKLRAAALTSRLVFEPAVREGSAAGRDRARAGDLARDAAAAAPAAPCAGASRNSAAARRCRRWPGSSRPPSPRPTGNARTAT